MPTELTASLYVTPATERGLEPVALLTLWENFRPVWTGQPVPERARGPLAAGSVTAGSVTAGSPQHQLAHGLLAYLWLAAPDALAADPGLARLVGSRLGGATTAAFTSSAADRVYRAVAPLVRVDLTRHPGCCIADPDLDRGQRCGLRLQVADARVVDAGWSA